MSFLSKLVRSSDNVQPARILLHGVAGVGKTSLAAAFPNPVFAMVEDGAGALDITGAPIKSWKDMMDMIGSLYEEEHDFKTFVVDSLDWFEPLVWAEACRANKWDSIEVPGYGKGYVAATDLWRQFVDGVNALRTEKGMTIINIAHTDVKRFDAPDSEPYDRYIIKLHKAASALLMEHSDAILFANYRVSTVKSEVGFGQKKTRAVGSGERILHTVERPSHIAKNRYSMKDILPLSYEALAEYLPNTSR
jgi:GTPase SAR1 family protein